MTSNDSKLKFKDLVLPLTSLLVGLITVVSTQYTQVILSESDLKIKELEITYTDKKENYVLFISRLKEFSEVIELSREEALELGNSSVRDNLRTEMEQSLIALDPFITEELRVEVWEHLEQLTEAVDEVYENRTGISSSTEEYENEQVSLVSSNEKALQNKLRNALFSAIE